MSDWLDEIKAAGKNQKPKRSPFVSDSSEDGDWLNDLKSTARVIDPVYPTLDTRGKAPINTEEQGLIDFILDNLAAGGGRSLENWGQIIEDSMRPESMTPSKWKEHQSPLFKAIVGNMQDTGREIYDRNVRQYEDGSLNYYLSQALQSAPESVATMAIGAALGGPVGGLLGAGARGAGALISQAPKAGEIAMGVTNAAKGSGAVGKALRAFTPVSSRAAGAVATSDLLESLSESNSTKQEYIEDAKRNGTYIPDVTELEAEAKARDDFLANFGWIGLMNIPQYNMLLGKSQKGIGKKLLRGLLGAGSEGVEELGQEGINAWALDKPLDPKRARDAFITGGIMGAGFQGAGYISDRVRGVPTEEEIEEEQNFIKEQTDKANQQTQDLYNTYRRYANAANESAARQAYRDASNDVSLRDWSRSTSHAIENDNVHDIIVRTALKHGVPPEKALAVAMAESNGNQNEISPVGAIGVMQLMPDTAAGLGVDPHNLEQNIDGGVRFLRDLYNKFQNWDLAFAAYNAGPNAVTDHVPQNGQTEGYVARINDFLKTAPEYHGSGQARNEGYFGEKGQGENNYWVRQGEDVSFEGGHSEMLNAVDMLGRKFSSDTGRMLVVTAGTNGTHADGEYSHAKGWKVDITDAGANGVGINEDGAFFTADFQPKPYLYEFVKYGQSLGLGMNVEGLGTSNAHIDVSLAGEQWADNSGNRLAEAQNYGGFNPRSVNARAGQNFSNYAPEIPSWDEYYKSHTRQRANQRQEGTSQSENTSETPKPLFDLNDGSSTTQKLFEEFATERHSQAADNYAQSPGTYNFFDGLFDTNGNFQNTEENRNAIRERYGDDFTAWATARSQQEETPKPEPQKQSSTPAQPNLGRAGKLLNNSNSPLKQAISQLKSKASKDGNARLLTEIQTAENNNDTAKLEEILKREGISITPQQDPVKENTPPENVLPKKHQRQLEVAQQQIDTEKGNKANKARSNQGQAIRGLLERLNYAFTENDRKNLNKGDLATLQKWQDKLRQDGVFDTAPAQETPAPSEPQAPAVNPVLQAREKVKQVAKENWNNFRQGYRDRNPGSEQAWNAYNNLMNQSEADENESMAGREVGTPIPEPPPTGAPTQASPPKPPPQPPQPAPPPQPPQPPQTARPADTNPPPQPQSPQPQSPQPPQTTSAPKPAQNTPPPQSPKPTQPAPPQQTPPQRAKQSRPTMEEDIARALAPISDNTVERRAQGIALARLFRQPQFKNINAPASLTNMLPSGALKAVQRGQDLLRHHLNSLSQTDGKSKSQPKQNPPPQPQSPAQKEESQQAPPEQPAEPQPEETQPPSAPKPSQEELEQPDNFNDVEPEEETPPPKPEPPAFTPAENEQPDTRREVKPLKGRKGRKKTAKDRLYENFKVDTHPYLKAHIDDLIQKARSDKDTQERHEALNTLSNWQKLTDISDESLDRWESELKQEYEARENERQNKQRKQEYEADLTNEETDEESSPFDYLPEIDNLNDVELEEEIPPPKPESKPELKQKKEPKKTKKNEGQQPDPKKYFTLGDFRDSYTEKSYPGAEVKKGLFSKKYSPSGDSLKYLPESLNGRLKALANRCGTLSSVPNVYEGTEFLFETAEARDDFANKAAKMIQNELAIYEAAENPDMAEKFRVLGVKIDEQTGTKGQRVSFNIDIPSDKIRKECLKLINESPQKPIDQPTPKPEPQEPKPEPKPEEPIKAEPEPKAPPKTTAKPPVKSGTTPSKTPAKGGTWQQYKSFATKEEVLDEIYGLFEVSDIAIDKNGYFYDRGTRKLITNQYRYENIDTDNNGTIRFPHVLEKFSVQERNFTPEEEKQKKAAEKKAKSDKEIIEAAKNPDTAVALKNLGIKIEDGKVIAPDNATYKAAQAVTEITKAYHGSRYDFDNFSLSQIGKGEGHQVHGWGLYFTKSKQAANENYKVKLTEIKYSLHGKPVSEAYEKKLEPLTDVLKGLVESPKKGDIVKNAIKELTKLKKEGVYSETGKEAVDTTIKLLNSKDLTVTMSDSKLYEVELPPTGLMLDEQKTFAQQNPLVQKALKEIAEERGITLSDKMSGGKIYEAIAKSFDKNSEPFSDNNTNAEPTSRLLNEHGIVGNTYISTQDGGRCYVIFDEKNIKIKNKFNIEGKVTKDTRPENIIDKKDYTPQQKLFDKFGKRLGVRTIFFRHDNSKFHGVHKHNVTFLNANSNKPLDEVFWHESLHWLANNNPQLYKALVKAAGITTEQRQGYLERTGRNDIITPDEINEEIIADSMENVASRTGLLQNIAGKERGLIQRVVQWLKDTMNKFIEMFRNPQGKLTTKQAKALSDEFGRIAAHLKDPNGQTIFRYNRRTGNIELADGRDLSEAAIEEMTRKGAHFKEKLSGNVPENKKISSVEINEWVPFTDLRGARETFKQAMLALKDVPIINKATGIVAQVGKPGRSKPLSDVAINKSLANGYSIEQHFAAAMNIKKLYENSWLAEESADKNNEANVISVKRFHCETVIGGEKAIARITAKEIIEYGHRLYTIELQELNKPAELENRTGGNSSAGSKGSTMHHIAGSHSSEEPSSGNISQSERDSKPKYSIGASDNSAQSLRQRIGNKVSSWFGDGKRSKHRNHKIAKTLEKIMGLRIAFNTVSEADGTIIDDFNKIIREPHAYQWETFLPKIGGKIAENLKLNPTEEMGNYIADWLLTGALNNTSAEARDFEKAMRDNPAQAELMQEIRQNFEDLSNMTGLARIKDTLVSMTEKKPLPERTKGLYHDAREQFIDDLAPVERAIDEMAKKLPADVAETLKKNFNPYKAFRNLRGLGEIPDMMIRTEAKDIEKLRTFLREKYPNLNFDDFKSLNMIIEEAGGDVEGLNAYAIAMLEKEVYVKKRDTKPDGTPKYPELQEYTHQFTEAQTDSAIKEGTAKFGQAQQDLVTFGNTLLAIRYDSGLMTQKNFFKTLNSYDNYVPMARVFEEDEEYTFSDSLKHKKGSKRDTWLPTEKLAANAHQFIRQAEQNRVKLQLANLVRCGGVGEIFAVTDKSNPNLDTTITFYEDGKRYYLETPDKSIVRAVNTMYQKSDGAWLMKMIRAASGFLRGMYTYLSLNFSIGNLFRDLPDAYIHNRHLNTNPFIALTEMWRAGFKSVWNKDQDFFDWRGYGGAQSSFVSEDVDYIERSVLGMRKGGHYFSRALDTMQKLAEYSEYITRVNTYKSAKNNLAAEHGGNATVTDKKLAALVSRDASIDFAKSGISTRKINRYLLFANAAVQGMDNWGRTIQRAWNGDKAARKELWGKVFRTMVAGVLAQVVQTAFNNWDDDNREKYKQAHRWEKNANWIFGDYIKIPKAMDIGVKLLSAITDEALNHAINKDPVEWRRIRDAVIDALPSITATIATPAFEAAVNYSLYRSSPIVPGKEQHLPAEQQYGKDTSLVAQKVGESLGVSPRKIDHLISGYLGSMFGDISHFPDYAFTSKPFSWSNMPVVRRFIFDPYKNPKVVKDYYETFEEQDTLWRGYQAKLKKGEKPALPEGYDRALHARLKAMQKPMRNLSAQEQRIIDDPKLSSSQIKEKLKALELRRMELAKKALQQAR